MKRLLLALTLLAGAATTNAAQAAECFPIGGVAIPNFFAEGDDQPIVISASLTGSVQNAAGKILKRELRRAGEGERGVADLSGSATLERRT